MDNDNQDTLHKEDIDLDADVDDNHSVQSISTNYNGILPSIIVSSPLSSASLSVSTVNVNGVTTGLTGVSMDDLKDLEVEFRADDDGNDGGESDGASDLGDEDNLDDILEESEEESEPEDLVCPVRETVNPVAPGTQEYVQHVWEAMLAAGGTTMMCGLVAVYWAVFLFCCVQQATMAVRAREKGR